MNRKEITESRAYQISKAALEHTSRSKNVVEAFEAGAEWADKHSIGITEEDLEKEVTNWWNDRYKNLKDDYKFGTNKDTYQTYLDGSMCDEKFYIDKSN